MPGANGNRLRFGASHPGVCGTGSAGVLSRIAAYVRRLHFDAFIAFGPLHAACLLIIWIPFKWQYLLWFGVSYAIRMFAITAGFHRYFSHRAFRVNRVTQFFLAFLAQTSAQKGVLWWAAHHRLHHRHSDRDRDVHSPLRRGFWWAHVGWVLSNEFDEYDPQSVGDFYRFPEIRWL